MKSRAFCGLMAAIGLLFASRPGWGEAKAPAAAALEGTVTAAAAQMPLHGAAVVLEGPGIRLETRTGDKGRYEFTSVRPGTGYSLTVACDGFTPTVRRELQFAGGEQRVLDVELQLRSVSQSITVSERADPITGKGPENSRTVSAAELSALPSNGRSLTRFALLNAHVRTTQGLASDGAAASRLSINSNSFRHTGHMIDGVSNYDVVFANAPQQSFSVSAIEELKVLTNQYSAEYGGSSAGIVAAATRAGTDRFHGEAFGYLRPSGPQAKPPLSSLHVPNERMQYGAALGGPIEPGKTNFFANFEKTEQNRGSFIQSPAPLTFTGNLREWFSMLRVDRRFGQHHLLTARINGQHSENNNVNDRIGGFTQPSAAQLSYTQAVGAQVTERMTYGTLVNELRASYSAYTPSATLTPQPAVSIVRPSFSIEGGSTNSWVHVRAAQVSENLGWERGRHEIHAGGDMQRQLVRDFSFGPFGEYRFAAGPPAPGQQPLQYTQTFGQAMLRYGQSYGSLFVQDNWRIAPRLTANLGLRYESQSITDDRNNFAPRIGLSWDPTGKGKTVVRAGAGLFYDQYYFYITRRFFLQGLLSPTATYTIPYGAPGFPAFPAPLAEPPAGANAGKRDLYLPAEKLLNPYSLQYSLGVQHYLGDDWVLSVDAFHAHTLKQMRINDMNAPAPFVRSGSGQRRTVAQADATRPLQTYAGVPVRNVLVVENSGSSIYDSLDLGVAKRFSKIYQLQAHYVYASASTYSMFFGEPNTGIPNDWANTGSAERGPSDFYQRHRLVTTSSFDLPGAVRMALTATAGSGLPVNPLTGLDNNGDTFTFDRPAGLGRNSFRGPVQDSVDGAASRRFQVTDAIGLEVRAEVFNVFNRNNYVRLNGTYGDGAKPGPLFLKPIAGIQNLDPSRQMQLALKLVW